MVSKLQTEFPAVADTELSGRSQNENPFGQKFLSIKVEHTGKKSLQGASDHPNIGPKVDR